MITIVLFLIVVTWVMVKYILHMRHLENCVRNVKSVTPSYPFIGIMYLLIGKSTKEIFETLVKVLKTGTPIKGYFATQLYVALDHPDDVKTILTSPYCIDKPFIYDYLPRGISSERSKESWKPIRKVLSPMLNLRILQSFIPIFNTKGRMLVEELSNEIGQPQFNILPYANLTALSSICATLMGIDLSINEGKDFIESIEAILHLAVKRFAAPWTRIDFIYHQTSLYKDNKKHFDNIRSFIDKAYKDHMTKENNNSTPDIENSLKNSTRPIISLFNGSQFNEEMVIQQLEGILIPGYETTGTTVAYIILMLAMHPNIQDQVFDELHSVYESQDEETTCEHIQKLQLLNRVIKETMRLFPSGPFITRTPTVETPIDKCLIPKDTFILISLFTLHRRHDIWGKDADKFNPDNFLPENAEKRHHFAYLPFSGGPRNCIGYKYAMFSLMVMLSAVLRNYKFSTDLNMSQIELKNEVTLKLENKHMVKLERCIW